jgi:hypothetical protein
LDRFALDRSRVRFVPPNEANDELFYIEEERHVRADNTFSFKSLRFEAPRLRVSLIHLWRARSIVGDQVELAGFAHAFAFIIYNDPRGRPLAENL